MRTAPLFLSAEFLTTVSPVQASACLLSRNSLPSVFRIYLAVIKPLRLECPATLLPPGLNFIDIYMKASNDLDVYNERVEMRACSIGLESDQQCSELLD